MNADAPVAWLLLVVSLPTQGATARTRIWRGLKALGCAALRDGVYLLPAGDGREDALAAIAEDCRREDGVAWLVDTRPHAGADDAGWRRLFDRHEDYAAQREAWTAARRGLGAQSPAELARLQRRLHRDFDALRAIDFFPGDASAQALVAFTDLDQRIGALLSPDEPQERDGGGIARLDPADYRGRTWATRRRLWVDRVASAWLIRRFIDPEARFLWLASPSACPRKALGFDFDGAAFTHVGERVTFETLMASFGLEGDDGLVRLAALVHQLDVGGEPVPEAAGLEAVLAGARERLDDDDALLAEMSAVLDSLHLHYRRAAARARP